jgi:pyruvate formate lyase activating enzyme
MSVKGFQGTSLLDYPGRIASLVFLGGCNLTCPFCHNPALVIEPEACPDLDIEALFEDLQERRRFIDGVVFTGGEPTLDPALPGLAARVKQLGLAVKLDTNGLAPKVVQQLLDRGLLDYLAIDLKTSLVRYPDLHNRPVNGENLLRTVEIARSAPVEVEFRTTCVPGWVDEETIHEWGAVIAGAPLWAIQQYHPEYALDAAMQQTASLPGTEVDALAKTAEGYVQRVIVRGV